MKIFVIVLSCMVFVNLMYAENDIPVSEDGNFYSDTYIESNEDSIWKFAWQLPNYSQQYKYLRSVPWIEPNGVGEMAIIGSWKRERDDSDTYSFATYTTLRPFALDFESFSIAFGISLVTRVNRLEDITKEINIEAFEGVDLANIAANGVQNHANQVFVNFSTLVSVPAWGLQFMFDVGYGQSNIRETINNARAEILGIAEIVYEEYQYQQVDDVLFSSLNVFKSFDRPYLNFIHLFVYGAYRLRTKVRESSAILSSDDIVLGPLEFGKQDLPFEDADTLSFFPDPMIPDEFNLSFIGADVTVRLFTLYTPWIEDRGISVNLYGGFTHISGQLLIEDFHGRQTKAGVTLGIFDAVTFRYAQIFEQGNQQEDGFEFTLVVQLSALVRKLVSD